MKVYVVGGFINPNSSLNIADLIQKQPFYLFKHCIDYDYFANEEKAKQFQLLKPSGPESFLCLGVGQSLKIVFEVDIKFSPVGFYIAKLTKASFSESPEVKYEVELDYKLTPMKFLLDSEQCNAIEIPSEEEIEKFLLFLELNDCLELSQQLPLDVKKEIYSYYKQLCFFTEPEVGSSLFDAWGCRMS